MAAADTDAVKDAIANAEESRKPLQNSGPDGSSEGVGVQKNNDQPNDTNNKSELSNLAASKSGPEKQGYAYDSVTNLPMEFYHYYHGSNTDMGTLIEVVVCLESFVIKLIKLGTVPGCMMLSSRPCLTF